MKRIKVLMVALLLAVGISSVAVAAMPDAGPGAAEVVLPDVLSDTSGWISAAFEAASGKDWKYLAALVLIGMTVVFRRYGKKWVPFFATAGGGIVSVMLMAVMGSVGLGLAAGSSLSWAMMLNAGKLAIAAAGGFAGLKHLLLPFVKWLWQKIKSLF